LPVHTERAIVVPRDAYPCLQRERLTTMRHLLPLAFAVATAIAFGSGGAAFAANTCVAENLTCATTMPIDGYCECTSRGQTKGGTVVAKAPRGRQHNSTAGGCGAHPNDPGCR